MNIGIWIFKPKSIFYCSFYHLQIFTGVIITVYTLVTVQVIPPAYRTPLPMEPEDLCRDTLTRVNHAWLLPALFSLIWGRLRSEPMGDTTQQPTWQLKVCTGVVSYLLLSR